MVLKDALIKESQIDPYAVGVRNSRRGNTPVAAMRKIGGT